MVGSLKGVFGLSSCLAMAFWSLVLAMRAEYPQDARHDLARVRLLPCSCGASPVLLLHCCRCHKPFNSRVSSSYSREPLRRKRMTCVVRRVEGVGQSAEVSRGCRNTEGRDDDGVVRAIVVKFEVWVC